MARDIRDDTALTADPERPGRFHAHLPEAWKVVYIFGGVSMYAALRAMQEQLGRADLVWSPRTPSSLRPFLRDG